MGSENDHFKFALLTSSNPVAVVPLPLSQWQVVLAKGEGMCEEEVGTIILPLIQSNSKTEKVSL